MIRIAAIVAMIFCSPFFSGTARGAENPFGIGNPWGGLDELGIGWCRAGAGATAFDWRRMEPEQGELSFEIAEREMENWLDPFGIKSIGLLGYTPDWASSAPEDEENKRGYPPADLRDWSSYIEETARYFQGRIPYYEVWNEQDIGFWKGTCNEYTQLLKSAYLAVKRGDPNAKVAFGGLAGVDLPFIRECYEHGAGSYFDTMAVHPYQWGDIFNDGWFMMEILDLRRLMLEHGDDKEILLTEFGWATDGTPESEAVQARLMMQAILTCLRMREEARVEIFCPFTVRDWGGPGYGFRRHDNTKKPIWEAYSVLINELLGKRYAGRLELGDNIRAYCYAPVDKDDHVLAVWCSDKQERDVSLEIEATEAIVRDMSGGEKTVKSENGKVTLTISPEPVYVREVSGVTLASMKAVEKVDDAVKEYEPLPLVWLSLDIPDESRRLSFKRGSKETIPVLIYNDSPESAKVRIEVQFQNSGLEKTLTTRKTIKLEPWEKELVPMRLKIPADATLELSDLTVTGRMDDADLPPLLEKVRVTDGKAIEFLANSQIDERYIFETKASGGAPSVRFGGEYWTYMFNLTLAESATIQLDVGAHKAGHWKVQVSNNHRKWKTVLEGDSNRDWHQADLTEFVGGPVFIRITGDDEHSQQLGELVLTMAMD